MGAGARWVQGRTGAPLEKRVWDGTHRVTDLRVGYSSIEAKAHPYTGGVKPTTGNPSTLVATASAVGVRQS